MQGSYVIYKNQIKILSQILVQTFQKQMSSKSVD
jgi:hypothetical protein